MKDGFMLLELLIAIALTLLLWSVATIAMLSVYRGLLTIGRYQQDQAMLTAAVERFLDDIRSAPSDAVVWKRCEPNRLIWQQGDDDVGWMIDTGKLKRVVGRYSVAQNQWRTGRTGTVVANALKKCLLTAVYTQDRTTVRSVQIDLETSSGARIVSAAMLNGKQLG
jgi:hypothetical protein